MLCIISNLTTRLVWLRSWVFFMGLRKADNSSVRKKVYICITFPTILPCCSLRTSRSPALSHLSFLIVVNMSSHVVFRLQGRSSHHNLKRLEEPMPTIDKHEVLVKIRGISLNYRDIGVANGSYPFPVKEQVIPCSDGAGEVVKVGSSIEGLSIGDHVISVFDGSNLYGPQADWHHGHGGPVDGMLRQYVALSGTSVVKIPKHSKLSFPQMASLVCTGVTVWNSLYGNLPLKPGQTVLFQGEKLLRSIEGDRYADRDI
jgi:hypothetical protein